MELNLLYILVGAYLIGSIPASFLIARSKGKDLRKIGSGNIGATNLSRVLGKKYGILGYFLDTCKGAIPVVIAWHLLGLPNWQVTLAGLAAIAGHIFPIFLNFKGGKGVATGSGVFLVLNPAAMGIALAIWGAVYFATKYVSLGSLLAALALPIYQIAKGQPFGADNWSITGLAVLTAIVVIVTHRSNIGRLLSGNEPKT